jgi:hypothetical protein
LPDTQKRKNDKAKHMNAISGCCARPSIPAKMNKTTPIIPAKLESIFLLLKVWLTVSYNRLLIVGNLSLDNKFNPNFLTFYILAII